MCYVCSCFGWILDLIQRMITFVLACWMSYAVGLGLLVAAVAGVAYGYNYSMAEFLTFTRSDVTVYMRRGQFYDQPEDVRRGFRRSGGDEEPPYPNPENNDRADYDDKIPPNPETKPLADSWLRAQDTRRYAEKLTKYNPVFPGPPKEPAENKVRAQAVQVTPEPLTERVIEKSITPSPHVYYKMTTPRFQGVRPISMSPNDLVYTAVWQSGSSQIIMRDFHRPTMKAAPFGDYEPDYGKGEMAKMGMEAPILQNLGEERSTINMDVGSPRRTSLVSGVPGKPPLRHWDPSSTPWFQDYSADGDDDNAIYKSE